MNVAYVTLKNGGIDEIRGWSESKLGDNVVSFTWEGVSLELFPLHSITHVRIEVEDDEVGGS